MHVKPAARHNQPRPSQPRRCDHCCGLALEAGRPTPAPDVTVRAYVVLVPGCGNQAFDLHPACADELAAE